MKATPAPHETPRAVGWGASLLYLAAIGVIYANSLPFGYVNNWQMIMQLALLPLVVVAVVLRVRVPYGIAFLGLIGIFSGTFAVFMVGIFSLAIRRRGPLPWLLAAVGGAMAAAIITRRDAAAGFEPAALLLSAALAVIIVAVAPTVVGGYVRARREFAEQTARRALRTEVERELAAQNAVHFERERIAQEMHDSLGHTLALVAMQAGALEVRASDPAVAAAAEQIRESARSGLGELRAVVHALGADAGRRPAPSIDRIPDLIHESTRAGADVHLRDDLSPQRPTVPASSGRLLHQAVQEGLTNAHRHAPGSPVTVVLSGMPGDWIGVSVSNALAPGGERGAGTGLDSLRSRVAVLGGSVDARAARGRFELAVRLPWEETS